MILGSRPYLLLPQLNQENICYKRGQNWPQNWPLAKAKDFPLISIAELFGPHFYYQNTLFLGSFIEYLVYGYILYRPFPITAMPRTWNRYKTFWYYLFYQMTNMNRRDRCSQIVNVLPPKIIYYILKALNFCGTVKKLEMKKLELKVWQHTYKLYPLEFILVLNSLTLSLSWNFCQINTDYTDDHKTIKPSLF